jgi:hypothetical protein
MPADAMLDSVSRIHHVTDTPVIAIEKHAFPRSAHWREIKTVASFSDRLGRFCQIGCIAVIGMSGPA